MKRSFGGRKDNVSTQHYLVEEPKDNVEGRKGLVVERKDNVAARKGNVSARKGLFIARLYLVVAGKGLFVVEKIKSPIPKVFSSGDFIFLDTDIIFWRQFSEIKKPSKTGSGNLPVT